MYYQHYGLIENPFGLSPDPRFLFLSEGHKEALATLYFGISEGKGFIVLAGAPGTGKTLLLNTLRTRTGHRWKFITVPGDPQLGFEDLTWELLDKLGGRAPRGASGFQVKLQISQALATEDGRSRKVILVIDEAQTLSPEVLERVRLLSNFETLERKLLQIVLAGQPGLVETINRPQLAQLKQRVGLWCNIAPLSPKEVGGYIQARLAVAGRQADGPFTRVAEEQVAVLSQGIPRLINLLCDNALLLGFAEGATLIEPRIVDRAASELSGGQGTVETDTQPAPAVPLGSSRISGSLLSRIAAMCQRLVAGSPKTSGAVTLVGTPAGAEEAMPMMSSFLSRKGGDPERGDADAAEPEGSKPELQPIAEGGHQVSVWSASRCLERLQQQFDEQIHVIEGARRLLLDRLAPFHQHLKELRRTVDQAMRQVEVYLKPLRQYLEVQLDSLERIGRQQTLELKGDFDLIDGFLADQRQVLEEAHRYLEEQQRLLSQYLEDQHRAIEEVFWDLEERLEPFGRSLKDQQKLLEAIAAPEAMEAFRALGGYCRERQGALNRFAAASVYRPQDLFAELQESYEKYQTLLGGQSDLISRVLEQTRKADLGLRDALSRPLPNLIIHSLPGQRIDAL